MQTNKVKEHVLLFCRCLISISTSIATIVCFWNYYAQLSIALVGCSSVTVLSKATVRSNKRLVGFESIQVVTFWHRSPSWVDHSTTPTPMYQAV